MLEHFKGEEVFVKKVLEYKDQALYKQRLVLTKFLNPYHQSIIHSIIGNQDDLIVKASGGMANCEMQRVIIAPSFYILEDSDFEIALMKITYAKAFGKLSHRDVLGALMSVGVKRELFGDIYEYEDDFYVAIDKKIYEYVKDNLTKIKRSKVKITLSDETIAIEHHYSVKTFIVSSFRLDKVIATLYGIPRSKAASYIRSGFVKVNHKEVEEINYLCNNSDIISLRRHGRVKFVDTKRLTKQNNHVVEGYFYQ
ncbi:RNA-binding protein [uncultured Thomasclavelia sp.]|uniref:YlmH family RNA-binding protein n=1 Tax=uncultured Thomasclavelia sp. TaxID=3025759 RepID=UPI0025EDB630|nr:YlmH/Sll1252 family protein [uncultured Thomasclavelia sp.]